jgi:hypothetical protein
MLGVLEDPSEARAHSGDFLMPSDRRDLGNECVRHFERCRIGTNCMGYIFSDLTQGLKLGTDVRHAIYC